MISPDHSNCFHSPDNSQTAFICSKNVIDNMKIQAPTEETADDRNSAHLSKIPNPLSSIGLFNKSNSGLFLDVPPGVAERYETKSQIEKGSTDHYSDYFAKSKVDDNTYIIRMIKPTFFSEKRNEALTYFVRELLLLERLEPNSVSIEDFEVGESSAACAIRDMPSLSTKLKRESGKSAIDFDQMIQDLATNIQQLRKEVKLSQFNFKLDNIYHTEKTNKFYLDYWEIRRAEAISPLDETQSKNGAEREVYCLGEAILDLNDELMALDKSIKKRSQDNRIQDLKVSNQLKNLVRRMLDPSPGARPHLRDIMDRRGEEETKNSTNPQQFQGRSISLGITDTNSVFPNHEFEEMGRASISKANKLPKVAHGILKLGNLKWGTGFLVGPDIVLTAATNLYDHIKKSYYQSIVFCPGEHRGIKYGHYKIKECHIPPRFIKDKTEDNYGIAILECPVEDSIGYFGIHAIEDEAELRQQELNVIVYTQGLNKSGQFFFQKDSSLEIDSIEGSRNTFTLSAANGDDFWIEGIQGAGVYYKDMKGGGFYIVGVLSPSDDSQNTAKPKVNLIKIEQLNMIKQWVQISGVTNRNVLGDNPIMTEGSIART